VKCLSLYFSLFFETIYNISAMPTDFMAEPLDSAIFATGFQSEYTKSLRYNEFLLSVVRRRDTFEELDAFKGSCTAGGLVGHHAADCFVENSRRCTEMERPALLGVDEMLFVQECMISELESEKLSRHIDEFAADNYNFLAIQRLFGNDGSEATEEVSFAINDNGLRANGRH